MTKPNTALVPRSIAETQSLAAELAKSNLLPQKLRQKQEDVFVCLMAGQEVGLTPMASIRSFDVVEGRPRMNSKAAVALVLASGKAKYFTCIEADDTKATYETYRIGDPRPRSLTYTIEEAKRAGLLNRGQDDEAKKKNNWNRHPRPMLQARASGQLAEDVYPDVLRGLSFDPPSGSDWHMNGGTPGEEEEEDGLAAEPEGDVVEAEIVEEASAGAQGGDAGKIEDYKRRISACTSAGELAKMGEVELPREPESIRAALRDVYTAKYRQLIEKARGSGDRQTELGV